MFYFDKEKELSQILHFNQQEKQCIEALLAASKQKGEEKQRAYAKHFEELGDIFVQRGELLQDTRQQLKAIAIYNLVLASQFLPPQAGRLYEDSPILFSSLNEIQVRLVEKIMQIEDKLIRLFGSQVPKQNLEDYWQKVEEAKGILRTVRQRAQNELALVEKGGITVQAIYQHIAEGLKKRLLKKLIDECLKELSLPEECIYSIIALGSLAREEATPFSDFEFAILIEDQGEEKNKIHKEYFRKFTYLLWIKVLNLRETTTRMMDIRFLNWLPKDERLSYQDKLVGIEWLVERTSPCKKGFSFDGQMEDGCHTPLGNQHHTNIKIHEIEENERLNSEEKKEQIKVVCEAEYELIKTPFELAQFQNDEWFKRKHTLTTVLLTVLSVVESDNNQLIQIYEAEVNKILGKPIKNSDMTCIQKRSLLLLKESSEIFKFRGGKFETECHYFDVKYHLYRLPNMLIDHLATYFDIREKNLWSKLIALFGRGRKIENDKDRANLELVVSEVLKIRLKAYLIKGHRDDHIIEFDPKYPERNREKLTKYVGVNKEYLYILYSMLICFQWTIEKFVKNNGNKQVLLDGFCHLDGSPFMRGKIDYLLLDFKNAAKAFKEAKKIFVSDHGENTILVAIVLDELGTIYRIQSHYSKAIKAYGKAKKIYELTYSNDNISVADTYIHMGNVYYENGDNIEAINAYEQAYRIYTSCNEEHHISIAEILNNLGNVYLAQGRYIESIDVYEKAKQIRVALYGKNHVVVADTLSNLGNVYQIQARFNEATN